MQDALKNIVENSMLSEETRTAIQEAWDKKVSVLREAVEAELRTEFAERYEHDKGNLVEALDRMVSDNLKKEIVEFAEDRKALVSERVQLKKQMREHAKKINKFVLENLAKEINSLEMQMGTYLNLYKAYESIHEYKKSLEYYKLFKQRELQHCCNLC